MTVALLPRGELAPSTARPLAATLVSAVCAALLGGCAYAPGLYFGPTSGPISGEGSARRSTLVDILRPQAKPEAAAAQPGADVPPPGALTAITPELIRSLRQQQGGSEAERVRHLFGKSSAYIIGPGDVLGIVVWGHPDINVPGAGVASGGSVGSAGDSGGYQVSAAGTIQFPYLGILKVAGLTEDQVRDLVTKGLSRTLRKPQVTVRTQAYRSGRVYIDGEVGNPGLLAVNDIPMSLPEAIARAGGLRASADRSQVAITRGSQTTVVNLARLGKEGVNPSRIMLAAGDMVRVHSRDETKVYVMGEVLRPSSQPLRDGQLNLNQALGESGGINPATGDASQIYVMRSQGDGPPQIFHLNARNPMAYALAEGFELQARDVVYVDPAPLVRWNRVISLILPSAQAVTVTREVSGN